jgi:hypothetical protein
MLSHCPSTAAVQVQSLAAATVTAPEPPWAGTCASIACTVIAHRLIVEGEVTVVADDPHDMRPMEAEEMTMAPAIRLRPSRSGVSHTALLASMRKSTVTQKTGQREFTRTAAVPSCYMRFEEAGSA